MKKNKKEKTKKKKQNNTSTSWMNLIEVDNIRIYSTKTNKLLLEIDTISQLVYKGKYIPYKIVRKLYRDNLDYLNDQDYKLLKRLWRYCKLVKKYNDIKNNIFRFCSLNNKSFYMTMSISPTKIDDKKLLKLVNQMREVKI